jgi:hypothetical protein
VNRHVYQSGWGGRIVVPLEEKARIIGSSSTPRFAKMVSWKYGQMAASKVSEDMELHHSRKTSRKLIQSLGAAVGQIAGEKELEWAYEIPAMEDVVTHISVSRDGTTTPILKEGYRETMCGTLSFYNSKGDRMHTIYAACAPEYGKERFDRVMDKELQRAKKQYPKMTYIGLADGAKNNWTYLDSRTAVQILDFFHATEYLTEVSVVMQKNEAKRCEWLDEACHDLKNKNKGAKMILRELQEHRSQLSTTIPEILDKTITYFENNMHRMNYAQYQKQGYPIGSGVTEAACKVVAKQRLSNSGMRWTIPAAQHILLLRGLICTKGRWQQFWENIDKKGT